MKLFTLLGLLLAAASLTAAPGRRAKSVSGKRENLLLEPQRAAAKVCAIAGLKIGLDENSFQGQWTETYPRRAAVGLCETVVDGLQRWCGERVPKTQLSGKIAVLRCRFGRESLRFQAERKGKTIFVSFNWETANLADGMQAWLTQQFPSNSQPAVQTQ